MVETEIIRSLTVLPDDRVILERELRAIRLFQELVRSQLVEGHDYGRIPGTDKPTLLQPGAEKITKLLKCADTYTVMHQIEDWDRGLFSFTVQCRIHRIGEPETVVSEGLGECNSMEARYRWRWIWPSQFSEFGVAASDRGALRTRETKRGAQYRVANEDVYSLRNTILKMAKKRALVDAAKSAGALSDLFTQDLDELELAPAPPAETSSPAPAPSSPTLRRDSPIALAYQSHMRAALEAGLDVTEFELPAGVSPREVARVTGQLATRLNAHRREQEQLAGTPQQQQ